MTNLDDLNRAQLTELYNSHLATLAKHGKDMGRKPVKIFKDHPTALFRARSIIEEAQGLRDKEHKAAPAKAKAPTKDRKWEGISITEPYEPVADMNRAPRVGSLRAKVEAMLKKGATWTAIHAAVNEAKPKGNPETLSVRSYRLVLDMWYQFGYGIKQNQETGVITIFR